MKAKLQTLFTSRWSVGNALILSRLIPPLLGHFVAGIIADGIASFKNAVPVRAVRANQWVISDGQLTGRELNRMVRRVYRCKARALYDYYHHLGRPKKALRRTRFSPMMEKQLERIKESSEGTLLVIPHLGNFDEAGQALVLRGLKYQILSYPNPSGGYRWENRLRESMGMEVTPMSIESMRQAKRRLMEGGNVLTGMDRPLVGESNYLPEFFGRPSPVPVAYIRMALQTKVPVVVIGVFMKPNGTLFIDASDTIEMHPHPDRATEIIQNAEAVLREAEKMIRSAPDQWVMFYPVWPEALNEMP